MFIFELREVAFLAATRRVRSTAIGYARPVAAFFALLCAPLHLAACGGGGDDEAPPQLDRKAPLADLHAANAETLCREVKALTSDRPAYRLALCTATAAGMSQGDVALCETLRDACIMDPPPACWLGGIETSVSETCATITAGEFLDCVRANANSVLERFDDVACGDEVVLEPPPLPPECTSLMASCPELFLPTSDASP
jgi:hypothetical protein